MRCYAGAVARVFVLLRAQPPMKKNDAHLSLHCREKGNPVKESVKLIFLFFVDISGDNTLNFSLQSRGGGGGGWR